MKAFIKSSLLVSLFVLTLSFINVPQANARGARGYVYGEIGSTYCDKMVFNGNSGYYVMSDGGKRTLKVTSYSGNQLVMKAYLRGKYIGEFRGTVYLWRGKITSYEGTFYSSRGTRLSFYLYDEGN